MRYAETGFNLEVDLTRGNIERVRHRPGGHRAVPRGSGHQRQDHVGPGARRTSDPFSPENLLIFGTGLLVGTPAIGCNRTIVSTYLAADRAAGLLHDGRLLRPRS